MVILPYSSDLLEPWSKEVGPVVSGYNGTAVLSNCAELHLFTTSAIACRLLRCIKDWEG